MCLKFVEYAQSAFRWKYAYFPSKFCQREKERERFFNRCAFSCSLDNFHWKILSVSKTENTVAACVWVALLVKWMFSFLCTHEIFYTKCCILEGSLPSTNVVSGFRPYSVDIRQMLVPFCVWKTVELKSQAIQHTNDSVNGKRSQQNETVNSYCGVWERKWKRNRLRRLCIKRGNVRLSKKKIVQIMCALHRGQIASRFTDSFPLFYLLFKIGLS